MGDTPDRRPGRATMSTTEAAERLGLTPQTVRRWIDAMDEAGTPVARRDRDAAGHPIPGRHRRPYVDEVEAYVRRREVELGDGPDADEPGGRPV